MNTLRYAFSMPHIYHVLTPREGGMGQKMALHLLRAAGIPCRPTGSMLVGHSAVEVMTNNRRLLRRADRILFGG